MDEFGLDDMDARILTTIIEKFGGGPVGLNTLAVAVGEDSGTLEEVYEPYLIQQGFLERTPRGRCATAIAYRRFGITPPPGQAPLCSTADPAVRTSDFDYELPAGTDRAGTARRADGEPAAGGRAGRRNGGKAG